MKPINVCSPEVFNCIEKQEATFQKRFENSAWLKAHSHGETVSATALIFSWSKQWVLWQQMDPFTC